MNVIEQRELGERDGFDLVAYKVVDTDTSPDEYECYDEVDLQAYAEGNWSYVGVVVEASKDGIEMGNSSMWGTEDGHSSNWVSEKNPSGWNDAFDTTLGGDGCYDLPEEALKEARKALAALRAAERKQRRQWPRRLRVATW